MKKCKHCQDLDEMEREYPDAVHHGANIYCDECGADYYEEYGTNKIWANNKQAKINHPSFELT